MNPSKLPYSLALEPKLIREQHALQELQHAQELAGKWQHEAQELG